MDIERQQRAGASRGQDFTVTMPTEELFEIAGNKYYIFVAGNKISAHCVDIRKVLQQIPGLEEVMSVDKCDVIVVVCPIVSRAGTDIEAALNELNRLTEFKPAIFVVLHHTFDQEKVVSESSRCVNRPNTLTVDLLFYEDKGLLKCIKNEEALDKIQQCLLPQNKQQNWLYYFWGILQNAWYTLQNTWTSILVSSDLTVASELMIVLLGISGAGKTAAGNMILGRSETCEGGASTVTKKITVERGTVAGEKVSVIDTPDWFSSGLSLEEIKENIQHCIHMFSYSPYAVLLVIPLKVKFTLEEKEMVEKMKMIFEKGCWEKIMILFITDDQETQNISFIQDQNLQKLLDNCENRFHIAQKENSAQTCSELLEMIEKMLAGNKESRDVCELTEADMKSAIAKSKQGNIEKRNYIKIPIQQPQQTIWISKGSAVFKYREQMDEEHDLVIINI